MANLVDIRAQDDQIAVVFSENGSEFAVSLSASTATLLIAGLAQAVVDTAEPNQPNTPWLTWPALARSADVSFDIEPLASQAVGIALKLPGLMPVIVEIPPEAAQQVAFALTDAAGRSRTPEFGA